MSFWTLILLVSAVLVFIALYVLQLFGFRLGRRNANVETPEVREGLGIVEGAVFALLGLLLAFQFGGATSRLDLRRAIAMKEANAIGTAYLRLDLLPPEEAQPIRVLFRQYVDCRIRSVEVMPDVDATLKEYQKAENMQGEIWTKSVKASEGKPVQVANLLLPSLNEMIDITTDRKTTAQTHTPFSLTIYLILVSLVGATLAGHSMSRSPRMPRLHMVLFAGVIATTLYFIVDMEFPRVGFIRIGAADQPMYELRESIK